MNIRNDQSVGVVAATKTTLLFPEMRSKEKYEEMKTPVDDGHALNVDIKEGKGDNVVSVDLQHISTTATSNVESSQQQQQAPARKQSADPPGWNSKWAPNSLEWMEQQIQQKTAASISSHRRQMEAPYQRQRQYQHSSSDDDDNNNDSFTKPISSWVPQIDKEERQEFQKWFLSHQSKDVLDKSVPTKSWDSSSSTDKEEKHVFLDDPMHDLSIRNSWVPHLHPKGPQALAPYPPGGSTSRYTKNSSSIDIYDEEEIIIEDDDIEIIEEEIVDESIDEDDDDDHKHVKTIKEQKITKYDASGKASDSSSSSSSTDNTDTYFSKYRKNKGNTTAIIPEQQKTAHTVKDDSTTTSNSHNSDDNIGETTATKTFSAMEKGQKAVADISTFLVDNNDTFQIFDDDWNFAPSRGTLCVLILCIVLALEAVAVMLYFVLRDR